MLPTKFQVNWPFGSGEEAKNRFSRRPPWRSSWISDGTILTIFDLQVTLMLPAKFQVSWPFGSAEAKNRFSRWPPRQPAWISDRNDLGYFVIYKSPQGFLPSFMSIRLSVHEKKWNIDFQDGRHGSHFGFLIGTILAIFDVQITPVLSTNFQVSGLSVQEKKGKIDFQDSRQSGHLGFLIETILAMFDLQVTPMLPIEYQVNWPLGSREEAKKRFSNGRTAAILDLWSERF